MRLYVIGDELVAGTEGPRRLGWMGRILVRSKFNEPPTLMMLTSLGGTIKDLCARWEGEVMSHLSSDGPRGLFVHIGANDILVSLSSAHSHLNLTNTTDRATALGIPCFVIGPAPLIGVDHHNVKELSRSYAEVYQHRGLPYANLITPLAIHDQWFEDMAISCIQSASGLTLSGQFGCALIARLILHSGWYEWTGAEPQD